MKDPSPHTHITLVFAGKPQEAEIYRQYRSLNPALVRYVNDLRDLMGLHFRPPIEMPWIGSFWERYDSQMLSDEALNRGIRLIHHEIVPSGLFGPR